MGDYFEKVAIGRVVTAPEVRRTGTGKALMEKSMEIVKKMYGAVPIRISTQCYLEKFYTSLGFQVFGEEYLEDGIPHAEMVLK